MMTGGNDIIMVMLSFLITGIFSLSMIAAFISVLIYFFRHNQEFKKDDGIYSKYIAGIYLALMLLMLIFSFIDKKIEYLYKYVSMHLPPEFLNFISYQTWVVIYVAVFIVTMIFSVVLLYIYAYSGLDISRKLKLPSFPFLNNGNDLGEKKIKDFMVNAGEVFLAFGVMVIITYFLFKWSNVQINETLKEMGEKFIQKGQSLGQVLSLIHISEPTRPY